MSKNRPTTDEEKKSSIGRGPLGLSGFDIMASPRQMEKQGPVVINGQRLWKVGEEIYKVVTSGGDSVFGGRISGQHNSPLSGI